MPISKRASRRWKLLDSAGAARGAASFPLARGSGPHPGMTIIAMSSAKIVKPTSLAEPPISIASAHCLEDVLER
eukprot:9500892-Pyramimonas_sp.AAC.1